MKKFTKEWLKKAVEDYDAARVLLQSDFKHYAIICFHLQQAAEKYVKAYLSEKNIEFAKIHDIEPLINNHLAPVDSDFMELLDAAALLSTYGVLPRYPGDYPEFTKDEAQQAFDAFFKIKAMIESKM